VSNTFLFTVNGVLDSFTGTILLATPNGSAFRFNSGGGNSSFGSLNATFDLGTGNGSLTARNAGTMNLGALKGGAGTALVGQGADSGTIVWSVGNNNLSTTFSGIISNSTSTRKSALTKVGTGTLTLQGNSTYTGPTIINNGTLNINGINALGGAGYAGLTFNGGTLQYATNLTSSSDLSAGSSINFASGVDTIDLNGNNVTYAAAIGNSGGGGLTLVDSAGGGLLNLSGGGTYSGATTISNGTLLVTGNLSSSSVDIIGGALGGGATINGEITNELGGTLAPGLSNGVAGTVMTINSDATLLGGGTNIMEISVDNNTHDTLAVSGTITYGGMLTIITNTTDTIPLAVGNAFTLVTATTFAGSFAAIQPSPGPGLAWSNDAANFGNFIVISNTTVTPPPPVASFSGSPTNIFVTQSVVFTNSSTGDITNSAWNFGDGHTASLSGVNVTNNASNTYSNAGSYTVSLTVSGNGGSSNVTKTAYIVVKPKAVIAKPVLSNGNFILSGTNGPAGQPYRILSSTNVALALVAWTPVFTNAFASDGSYSYTNTPLTGRMGYFILVSP
jgi:autotransporter-associated beta strand protein